MYQRALFVPESKWVAPKISDLPRWPTNGRVAVDIETCDPHLMDLGPSVRRGGYIVGVSFAIEDGAGFYLPVAHEGGDNLDREAVLRYLRDQAQEFRGTVVGTNLPYDLDYLQEVGVVFPQVAWFRDVQVAEPLIDELQDRYSLDRIAQRYKLAGKDTGTMAEAATAFGLKGRLGANIWRLPARYVAEYAIQDVFLPLKLLRYQERRIEEQNLQEIYDLESRLLPVLLKMRRKGVRFSHDRLDRVEAWSEAEEQKALKEVEHHSGVRIELGDVWQPDLYVRALAEIGITPPLTSQGKPSVTASLLASIDHPVARGLARARKVNKLRSTFVSSIRNYAVGDRVHGLLNQLRRERDGGGLGGAAFGRLSSEHPNLQQQPARDPEMGPLWRSIYLPDEGGVWACLDYSQQEPRLLTHYAEITGCAEAGVAAERYRRDPLTDNHQMMAELTGLPRKQAKNIYLGKCYGMGGAKLCHEVGLPTEWIWSKRLNRKIEVAGSQGKAILEQFDRRAPYVKELARQCERRAKSEGYLVTLLGRRCRFPQKDSGEYDWTHKALNRLIQGSAADQTKAAMVEADRLGYSLQLQVHDELDLTVANREQAEGLAEVMRSVVKLRVPSRVDVELGPSWGEIA